MTLSETAGKSDIGIGGKDMAEVMTDKQFDGILQMIEMIIDGCKDLEEAKRKIAELRKEKKEKTE